MSESLKSLILHDETGQPWVLTIRSDGQLQTAKYPDGEPMTPTDYMNKSADYAIEQIASLMHEMPAPPTP